MFLTLKTKTLLIIEEMLPKSLYTEYELRKIRNLEEFGGWCHYGYYVKTKVCVVKDWSAEDTLAEPNWSIEDFGTRHDYFCQWLLLPEERVIL